MLTRQLDGGGIKLSSALAGRHYPAAATAGVVTILSRTNQVIVIDAIYFSYSAAPTGGELKIEDGAGTVVFDQYVTAAGPGAYNITRKSSQGNNMIVTLTSGQGAIVGKLDVDYHYESVLAN